MNPPVEALSPADYDDETKLAGLLWTREPSVLDARAAVGQAMSEVVRAGKFPNPTLDFNWGTIPVGATNPTGLQDPLTNVPNYAAGLSELLELAKRGPRQAATVAELEKSRDQAQAALAEKEYDLFGAIGKIAHAQERLATMDALVSAANELLDLDRARADKGDVALVDVDRTEVEAVRLRANRDQGAVELNTAQAECSAMIAASCPRFASPEDARRYLQRAIGAQLPDAWSQQIEDRRPDIRALADGIRASEQREELARRKVVPDVTVRVGYTYDTYVISGNQRNSLALGVELPLPVLDQGQADLLAAHSTTVQLTQQRRALLQSGKLAFAASARQRGILLSRAQQLDAALAKAKTVSTTIEETARRGGVSMSDVLLARRSYQELLLDRDDLDQDAYEASLKVRQAAAALPGLAEPQGTPHE